MANANVPQNNGRAAPPLVSVRYALTFYGFRLFLLMRPSLPFTSDTDAPFVEMLMLNVAVPHLFSSSLSLRTDLSLFLIARSSSCLSTQLIQYLRSALHIRKKQLNLFSSGGARLPSDLFVPHNPRSRLFASSSLMGLRTLEG